jgi:hypothetical protein
LRTSLRRSARLVGLFVVAASLLTTLALMALSATEQIAAASTLPLAAPLPRIAPTYASAQPPAPASTRATASGSVYVMPPGFSVGAPALAGPSAAPDAADFVMDKKVMLQSEWNQTKNCATSVNSLTVYYGTPLTYCYFFYNIGTTSFITHTFTDDRLGSLGTFYQTFSPGASVGFVGVPPDGLTQDTTNTAVWTAVDQFGTSITRVDKVTVKVVVPLSGHVFIDQNGDGTRNPGETGGVADAPVRLVARPPDPKKERATTSYPSGYFEFRDVAAAGPYTVSLTVPAGYVATSPTQVPVNLVFGVPVNVNFGVRAATPTPSPTASVTLTPTDTATGGPTPTPSETPEVTPTATGTPTPTETPQSQPTIWLPMVVYISPNARPPLAPFLMPVLAPEARPSFTLSWTPIYGTKRYELQEARDVSFGGQVERVYYGDATTFEARSHGIGTHYYRVRAENLVGASEWSETRAVPVSWETEPNNALPQANGGLISDLAIYALPDDPDDFFAFIAPGKGTVTVRMEGMADQSARLMLYYDNIGNLVASDTTAPYMVSTGGSAPAGVYYIRVFAQGGFSAATPYYLIPTFR